MKQANTGGHKLAESFQSLNLPIGKTVSGSERSKTDLSQKTQCSICLCRCTLREGEMLKLARGKKSQ